MGANTSEEEEEEQERDKHGLLPVMSFTKAPAAYKPLHRSLTHTTLAGVTAHLELGIYAVLSEM
jgi:hypothetical protein